MCDGQSAGGGRSSEYQTPGPVLKYKILFDIGLSCGPGRIPVRAGGWKLLFSVCTRRAEAQRSRDVKREHKQADP